MSMSDYSNCDNFPTCRDCKDCEFHEVYEMMREGEEKGLEETKE